jgi:tRNA pseudouridine-54 N-methylase
MVPQVRSIVSVVVVAVVAALSARADVIDHAHLFKEETVAEAKKLIGQMREDVRMNLVIETFDGPGREILKVKKEKGSKATPEELKAARERDVEQVSALTKEKRTAYFLDWAREQAQYHKVNGIYLLICRAPEATACVVEPESIGDYLFPKEKRAWLEDALRPSNNPLDGDTLNKTIQSTWDAVRFNRARVFDHALLFQPETISEADKLISRMREDTKKDFVVETFTEAGRELASMKREKRDKATPDEIAKAQKADHLLVKNANIKEREIYFHDWAREQAKEHGVNGVYLLICKKPQYAACVVVADSDKDADHLFPPAKRAWLEEKMRPRSSNKHYDDDLLSSAIPGVWYTVQYNVDHPHEGGSWSWTPTLLAIAVFVGGWLVIGAVRGIVVLATGNKPLGPDLSRTRLGDTTAVPGPPRTGNEDSVDY